MAAGAQAGAEAATEGATVFSEEQAWDVLADIPNDSATALVLLEHHWAVRLRDASSRPTASVSVMGSSARWISSRSACSPAPRRRSNTPSRQHRPARDDPVGPERTVEQPGGRHVRITQGRAAYSSTHRPPGRPAPELSRCPTGRRPAHWAAPRPTARVIGPAGARRYVSSEREGRRHRRQRQPQTVNRVNSASAAENTRSHSSASTRASSSIYVALVGEHRLSQLTSMRPLCAASRSRSPSSRLRAHSPGPIGPDAGARRRICPGQGAAAVQFLQVVDRAVTKHGPPLGPCRVSRRHPGWVIPPVGGDGASARQVDAARTVGRRAMMHRFTVGLLIVSPSVC
jgi:hypothetical protein